MSDTYNEIKIVEQEIVSFNIKDSTNEPACFVAVHIGAGYHSPAKTGVYRQLCEKICNDVIQLLRQGYNARTACATAVAFLEV